MVFTYVVMLQQLKNHHLDAMLVFVFFVAIQV